MAFAATWDDSPWLQISMKFLACHREKRQLHTRLGRVSTAFPCTKSLSASRCCRLKSHGSRTPGVPNKHRPAPPTLFLKRKDQADAKPVATFAMVWRPTEAAGGGGIIQGWDFIAGLIFVMLPAQRVTPSSASAFSGRGIEARRTWNVRCRSMEDAEDVPPHACRNRIQRLQNCNPRTA